MAGMSSGSAAAFLLLLLLLFLMASFSATFAYGAAEESMGRPVEMKSLVTHELKSKILRGSSSRRGRALRSFQICSLCTCCGGSRGLCLPSPCCYAINCNIPKKPFGFCAFTPKACNCFGCYL